MGCSVASMSRVSRLSWRRVRSFLMATDPDDEGLENGEAPADGGIVDAEQGADEQVRGVEAVIDEQVDELLLQALVHGPVEG